MLGTRNVLGIKARFDKCLRPKREDYSALVLLVVQQSSCFAALTMTSFLRVMFFSSLLSRLHLPITSTVLIQCRFWARPLL